MKPSYYNYVIENKNGNGDALYYNMRTGSLAHMEAKHHKEFVQFIETGIEISDEKFLEELKYCGFLIEAINEQISNFAQTYPTNLKASSNEALLFMRRYRFANCSCFSCCFKDAYPSSNVQ